MLCIGEGEDMVDIAVTEIKGNRVRYFINGKRSIPIRRGEMLGVQPIPSKRDHKRKNSGTV